MSVLSLIVSNVFFLKGIARLRVRFWCRGRGSANVYDVKDFKAVISKDFKGVKDCHCKVRSKCKVYIDPTSLETKHCRGGVG